MANNNALFSLLTFPQAFESGALRFNLVFIPRNFSPLLDLSSAGFPGVGPFADAANTLQLQVRAISGLNQLPAEADVSFSESLSAVAVPASARPIFTDLQSQFNIDDIPSNDQLAPSVSGRRIKKYLNRKYRSSFNFTNPRTRDAVIDDSYHCAFKDKGVDPTFQVSSNRVSWGEVYAYCLRNPAVAERVGLIYTDLTVNLPQDFFVEGGWLYVDFDSSGYFATEVQADDSRACRYAARIPAITDTDSRILFAPVLFPVAFSNPLVGNFDEVQREAADYDDGFAKIPYGWQPISTNFLQEEASEDMVAPTKDMGIRLGWDDEQVLIWQNRQLTADDSVPGNERLDAPLGVFNYRIDVRELQDGTNPWISLNQVQPRQTLALGGQTILTTDDVIELGTEVYPMQLDADQTANYWLPAFFTQWSGHSLVIPDEDAALIYRTEEEIREYTDGDGVTAAKAASLQRMYEAVGLENIPLVYGQTYEFRVRMGDISGGGPGPDDERIYEAIAQDSSLTFKRHVAPNGVRIDDLPENHDLFTGDTLRMRRPLLDYPNVQFTNRYENVVDKLVTFVRWASERSSVGLPDPDTDRVAITVEVKGLKFDNELSTNGKDGFYQLYTTTRDFNALDFQAAVVDAAGTIDPFEQIETPIDIPLNFVDAAVLEFGDPSNLGDLGFTQDQIDGMQALVLPRGRDIRLTIQAIGNDDDNYFALNSNRQGKTTLIMLRRASTDETALFNPAFDSDRIEGVYLQPTFAPRLRRQASVLGRIEGTAPDTAIYRLAEQMDIETRGLSLIGQQGVRVQFGCSRNIRHSLAPDGTSLTFSSRTDLFNHWLIGINLRLRRDWSWDATRLEAFRVIRRFRFSRSADWQELEVGTIDMHPAINLQALNQPDRRFSQLVFLDAVQPKPDPAIDPFPDTIDLEYDIIPQFREDETPDSVDPVDILTLRLPVTTIPSQEPELASAGIALSPYRRDKDYANTEARQKHLWVELKKPIEDPNDALFIRFLAYAPDPLLSDLLRYPELIKAPEEPRLPLDPEPIRVIRPGQSEDQSGLNLMMELTPANVGEGERPRHFLVPLPPGLHAQSDELFGFFTYELRVGHKEIWSTAQGRFGRPLRVTGVQHPAPTLFCTIERSENDLIVSAPYAVAVANGKNVTSKPPRTELWCLVYAQVRMAHNQDNRNILLGEIALRPPDRRRDPSIGTAGGPSALALQNKDAKVYGSRRIPYTAIQLALKRYGLPVNSPLSIVCAELFPTDYRSQIIRNQGALQTMQFRRDPEIFKPSTKLSGISFQGSDTLDNDYPLSERLGHFRIMRVSPLTAVPEVCCVDC